MPRREAQAISRLAYSVIINETRKATNVTTRRLDSTKNMSADDGSSANIRLRGHPDINSRPPPFMDPSHRIPSEERDATRYEEEPSLDDLPPAPIQPWQPHLRFFFVLFFNTEVQKSRQHARRSSQVLHDRGQVSHIRRRSSSEAVPN